MSPADLLGFRAMTAPAALHTPTAAPEAARLPELVRDASHSDDALAALSAGNRDLRIERTAQGALIIMPPTGARTGNRNSRLTTALTNWADTDGTGLTFDSSAGFRLPNGAVRSADAAWVLNRRWEALTADQQSKFAPLCPDFVLELLSPTDALDEVKAKLAEFISNGAQLGWIIDPLERSVHVYRPGAAPVELRGGTAVDGDPVLPGFVLDLTSLW